MLRILGSPSAGTPTDYSKDGNIADNVAQAANMFEVLEIEPDTEHTMTEPTNMHFPRKVVYKEAPSREEFFWLLYCFFEDFNDVRWVIEDIWANYQGGKRDLLPAAAATNIVSNGSN